MFGQHTEIQRSSLIVGDDVDASYVLANKLAPEFIAGTGPLRVPKELDWKVHAGIVLGLLGMTVFLQRAIFAFEWDWTDSALVFFAFIGFAMATLVWLIYAGTAFHMRNDPTLPTHLVTGAVSKVGRSNKYGQRDCTILYALPEGAEHKTKHLSTGNRVVAGQRVVVLHYGPRKASVL